MGHRRNFKFRELMKLVVTIPALNEEKTIAQVVRGVPRDIPGIDEAKKRLAHLEAHGPTQFAFTFKTVFPPDESFQRAIDWSSFQPCPAT